jgi:hypothetical protein
MPDRLHLLNAPPSSNSAPLGIKSLTVAMARRTFKMQMIAGKEWKHIADGNVKWYYLFE